ncbi:hypothetical protein [Ramlibacter sp.]|uniref:hypothetical protein n=1 Tax=Ramlibacter sp. TaxID=1917967 RepID=UPI003D1095DB
MAWILVMYVYAGMLAKGDSVAMLTVPVASQEVCEREGRKGEKLVGGSAKEYRYLCLKVDK